MGVGRRTRGASVVSAAVGGLCALGLVLAGASPVAASAPAPHRHSRDRWWRQSRRLRLQRFDLADVGDEHGNTLGGSSFCFLLGTTVAFTPEQIAALYPDHRAFVAVWTRATNSARRAGFLVDADAKELLRAAKQSDVAR